MRHGIKHLLATLWYKGRPQRARFGLKRGKNRDAVPVLCYHSVSPEFTVRGFRAHPGNFEEQISYLTSNYKVISMAEFAAHIYGGKELNGAAVLTFDDGYRDNYTYAYPILEKYKCPATIFLATGFIDKEVELIEDEVLEPLEWSEIIEMKNSDMISFGAHSHTHRILSSLTVDEIKEEIKVSKKILEERLGDEVDLFAYPNGQLSDFNQEVIDILKNNGFIAACSTVWSTSNTKNNLFSLNRVTIDQKDDLMTFKLKLLGAYDYIRFIHHFKKYLRGVS